MATVSQGISGRPPEYDASKVTQEHIANELALLQLGDVIPLDIKIDVQFLTHDLKKFDSDWQPYLPRDDRPNNRYGLTVTTYPGYTHKDSPSLAEICVDQKRKVNEIECNAKTDVYRECRALHPLFNEFPDLGRTFFVRSDIGGYFVPHRDHPSMPRDVFRLIAFVKNCGPYEYDWLMEDQKLQIEEGRVYYVNTRKMHRTISWVNGSTHLIMNVPFNSKNVSKVISHLQHRH